MALPRISPAPEPEYPPCLNVARYSLAETGHFPDSDVYEAVVAAVSSIRSGDPVAFRESPAFVVKAESVGGEIRVYAVPKGAHV